MYKYLLVSLFLVTGFAMQAQGNLQFNQVISITNGQTYTVPAGKVLKVESVNTGLPFSWVSPFTGICGGLGCYYSNPGVNIDGISFFSFYGLGSSGPCGQCPASYTSTTTNQPSIPTIVYPIWLGEGKIITIGNGQGVKLSAIEFNIVP